MNYILIASIITIIIVGILLTIYFINLPPNVDCKMSEWSSCDFTSKTQNRTVSVPKSGTGTCLSPLQQVCNYLFPTTPVWELVYDNEITTTNPEPGTDKGKTYIDSLFSHSGVLKRVCNICVDSHKEIYYKRITPISTDFSIYDNIINTWGATNNLLNTDFKLYSTLADLQADTNSWQDCDYGDTGIGGFRDCGPSSQVGGQWNSLTNVNGKKVQYYILKN